MDNTTSLILALNATRTTGLPPWYKTIERLTCGITFAFGCPANLIIIYLVRKLRSLKSVTFYFIASLAVADFLVLTMMLFYILHMDFFKTKMSDKARDFLYPSSDMFLATASMVNVACVSVDRAIAVAFPLQYDIWVTPERSKIVLVIVWAYSGLVLIASSLRMVTTYDWSYHTSLIYTCFALSYFVPISLILLSYSAMILFAVRGMKFTKSWERRRCSEGDNRNGSSSRARRKILRELKISVNILLLVVPFTLGWTFFIGTHIYEEAQGNGYVIMDETFNLMIEITPWLISGLNPFLYFTLTRSIRQGFFNHVRKEMSKHSYNTSEPRRRIAMAFAFCWRIGHRKRGGGKRYPTLSTSYSQHFEHINFRPVNMSVEQRT